MKPKASASKTASAPASASGIQTVSSYKPTDQEMKYLEAVRELADKDLIPRDVAATVECIQLNKVSGLQLSTSESVRNLLEKLAEQHDVGTKF